MSKKKRLLAVGVAMLTIPAFTLGDAPYTVTDIADQAFAISTAIEPTQETPLLHKDDRRLNMSNLENVARATKECGTEETTLGTEAATQLPSKYAEVSTTAALESQGPVRANDVSKEEVHTEPTDPTEPPTQPEPETVIEEVEEIPTEEVEIIEIDTEAGEETESETEMTEEESGVEPTEEEFVWNGPWLNPVDGIVRANQSPSGYKETFYNRWMFGCLDLIGYSHDGYDEREDGVKTYNGYVMVASPDLNAHPKGSLIPTTLGMGIVVDFCPAGNLDVAVTW